MQIVDSLTKAKNLIVNYGWIQGATGSEHVGFCARGAVNKAVRGHAAVFLEPPESRSLYYTDTKVVVSSCPVLSLMAQVTVGNKSPNHLARWNNARDRTKEEVLEAFDAAIAIAKTLEEVACSTAPSARPLQVHASAL